ncbi:hypothetical protein ACGF5T_34160 [Streptomyces sp. NPDC047853]|uniref:hypothetical protein n=1 Tax=unclassified Streptomyces TaxID=2593676 RepID=UPI0034566CA2
MGRHEQPLDPRGGPLALFARDLRGLRRAAGSPSYQRLAARTHFAASTLAAAAGGKRLPSAAVLAAYVAACGGDVATWETRRRALSAELAQRSELSELSEVAEAARLAELSEVAETAEATGPSAAASVSGAPAQLPPPRSLAQGPSEAGPARDAPAVVFAGRRHLLRRAVGITGAALLLVTTGAASAPRGDAETRALDSWFARDAAIPARYRRAIVAAGTACAAPQVSPALVAAMLKTESDFDPQLSDPAADEYGIARWTPRVLRYYLPEGRQDRVPRPPLDAETSIAALGRMLCTLAPQLEGVAGDPALNLAAAYRTATWVVQKENGIPDRIRPYTDRVRSHLLRYAPEHGVCLPYATAESSYPAPCGRAVAGSPAA